MKSNSAATVKQWAKVKKHEASEKKSGHEKMEKAMAKGMKKMPAKAYSKKKGK